MRKSGSFASLSPTLLANKGRARPAMRPQVQAIHSLQETGHGWQDDLGWNDMGEPEDDDDTDHDAAQPLGEVVAFDPAAALRAAPAVPEVVRQQATIANRIAPSAKPASAPVRRSALADGRRAAFTLRLDSERHLALRLASTIANRSAQQIVTEALDRLIADMPELAELAATVRKRR